MSKAMTEWSLKGGIGVGQVNQMHWAGEGIPGSRSDVINGREARSRKWKPSALLSHKSGMTGREG